MRAGDDTGGERVMRGPAMLFCPADRPDRYAKAAAAADTVIIDLEDAVGDRAKDLARDAVVAVPLDPERTMVRVNPVGTADFADDLAMLSRTAYRSVMVAKCERASELEALAGFEVVALCETPAGIENAAEIARRSEVVALMWGAEDLVGALGGRSSRNASGYRDVARYARSRVLIAAGAAGKAAIDSVVMEFGDLERLAAEVEDAAAVGFAATACIHPSQVAVIRAGYAPTAEQREWAERVLAAAEANPGVFRFEGRMVDGPVLVQARTVLGRHLAN